MRGFFEIGVFHPKHEVNIGTLWRSAFQLGASGIFTIGRRYQKQSSDTPATVRHIPMRNYENWEQFNDNRPHGAILIGVETSGYHLSNFCHPERAIYLLGAEDHGLPDEILAHCQIVIGIESVRLLSYNVAIAGSIVMWHRQFGSNSNGIHY